MINVLSEYSLKKQNEDLPKILESAFPDNDIVQTSLQSLTSRKATWVQRLQILWDDRTQPILNVFQVKEICLQYQQEMNENKVLIQVFGGNTPFLPNAREFVVKTRTSWNWFLQDFLPQSFGAISRFANNCDNYSKSSYR